VILDTLQNEYPEITVTSMHDALNTIRNGGLWTDSGDGRNYTRAFTDQYDFRLRGSSPARNAGDPSVCSSMPGAFYFGGVKKACNDDGTAMGGAINIGAAPARLLQPMGSGFFGQ
jgi:hypothetical protein